MPPDAVVFLCEGGRIEQRVKTVLLQLHQDTETLMEAGLMAETRRRSAFPRRRCLHGWRIFRLVMLDALPTSRHPLKPRGLLAINARAAQLLRRQLGDCCHGLGALPEHRQCCAGALRR